VGDIVVVVVVVVVAEDVGVEGVVVDVASVVVVARYQVFPVLLVPPVPYNTQPLPY
jgi:hypothetical protein